MLDNLATRYHLLPSEVIRRADTLDVMVMDFALSWQKLQHERMEAESQGRAPPAPKMSVEEMQAMIAKARSG